MIFENYSYKIKFRFLLVFFVVLSITAYKRSFSSLFAVMQENYRLNEKITLLSSKTKNSNQLNNEISILNKMIGKDGVNKEKTQQEVVNFLLKNSANVSIYNLQAIHEFQGENYRTYSYQIDLTGNFNSLIKLTYSFEKYFDYCKIVSSKYYTVKNNKNETLHLKLIFQKYENTK